VSLPTSHSILRFRAVTVRYGRRVALDAVTADIPCGGLVAVVGPNGAGKSTLLRALLGWHPLHGGEIRIGDSHTHHQLPRFAYVPQAHAVDYDFPATVGEVVAQARWPSLRPWQRPGAADRAAVERALAELEIADLARRPIRELSGGQRQRMFLARALAQGADIFLLDEPFAALDLRAARELTHILGAWRAQGRTVLAAMHELETARAHFTHALLLATRLVAAGPVAEALSEARLAEAFGEADCAHATDGVPVRRTAVFPS
jgi:manganese/zinc/iron transport system ATP- binding protein